MRRVARHFAWVVLVLVGSMACDQLSKSLAREYLPGTGVHSYLGDTFRLEYAQNPGAFLSLGDGLPSSVRYESFVIGVAALVVALLAWAVLATRLERSQRIALAMFGAGGAGNLVDRIRFDGTVTDFLNLGIGPLRTGIFNLADMVLLCGAIALLLSWNRRRPTR